MTEDTRPRQAQGHGDEAAQWQQPEGSAHHAAEAGHSAAASNPHSDEGQAYAGQQHASQQHAGQQYSAQQQAGQQYGPPPVGPATYGPGPQQAPPNYGPGLQQTWGSPPAMRYYGDLVPGEGARTVSKVPAWLLVGGSVGLIFGSMLPWVDMGFVSVSGLQGDGIITLVLALITAGLGGVALATRGHKGPYITAALPLLLAMAVVVFDLYTIGIAGVEVFDERISALGIGLPVCLAAGLVATAGVVMGIVRRRHPGLR